ELNLPVDAQIGPRAGGERLGQNHVHADGAAGGLGIDARDLALDAPVARVDFRVLPDPDVLRLGFRDAQLGFQVRRIRDAREVRAGRHLRAALDRYFLEDAGHAGLHLEIVQLADAEV